MAEAATSRGDSIEAGPLHTHNASAHASTIVVSGNLRARTRLPELEPLVVSVIPSARLAAALVVVTPLVRMNASARALPTPVVKKPLALPPPMDAAPAAGVRQSTADRAVTTTAGGAALMGLGMIFSGVLGYVQTVAMTHMVPRSTYGVFVLVYTTAIFASQLTKLGFDGVLLRFLPTYRARHEYRLAAGLSLFSFWVPAAVSVVCALGLSLLASPIAWGIFHSGVYVTPLREGALIIPLNALQSVILNGLQALKVVKLQVYVGKVIEPVATLGLLTVFYLIGFRLEALIFAYVFGLLASVVVGRLAFKREAGELIRAEPEYAPGFWVRFGAAMLFNVMTVAVIQSTDILGLGAFASPSQVSLYGAADRLGSFITMPFFALNIIFAPMIAELYARGDLPQLDRMFALVTRWSFGVSWPICLCCVIFSKPILGIFGKGYAAGSVALIILAAGSIINAATGPVGSMLAMTGRLRVLWFNASLRLVTNVALVFALIPRFGVLGAAEASSLTVVILNVVALLEVWWIMKIQPYRCEILKPLIAGGVASVAGLLLMYLTRAGSGSASAVADFGFSLGLVLAFIAVYAVALVCLGLTSEDRLVFTAVRMKFFRS